MNRFGLRGRLMIIGVVGLSLGLLLSGLAFYGALTVVINRTLDRSALASANDIALLVNEGRLPELIPTSGAQLIQVVDAQQRVVASSATADRITPLLDPAELTRARSGEALVIPASRLGQAGALRVRAVSAGPAGNPVSVITAWAYGDVLAARQALRAALLIALPLLVAALGVIAWRAIGYTLRPVESLRAGAEQISRSALAATQRTERLPVPPAHDEIRALALTLNGMLERLAEARGRQRDFVADAAHELRSPIASMRVQLEVAEHLGEGGTLPAELLVDLGRLSALVEDLLLLARTDAADRPAGRADAVDLDVLLTEVAAAHADAGPQVRVRPGPVIVLTADASELRRAVDNLVANAVRHARTTVELAGRRDRGGVVISVSDDGPGIAPADRERVFDRFARLDDARARDSGGSGLGLAIVRELLTRAGGTVGFVDGDPPFTLRAEITLDVAAE